jgi:dimeric dUTPase (all-alpha-NTP-PPase superfamily)
MQQEMAELTDSVSLEMVGEISEVRWAKRTCQKSSNLFHFLISIAQVLGMSAEDVYQADLLKKNAVNHQRQDSGYVKKRNDSRHI